VFYLCPSCSQKRTLLFGEYMNEHFLLLLPHRQMVFTFPKVLRAFFRHDRRLYGEISKLVYRMKGGEASLPDHAVPAEKASQRTDDVDCAGSDEAGRKRTGMSSREAGANLYVPSREALFRMSSPEPGSRASYPRRK
jgi:hypothetical protein